MKIILIIKLITLTILLNSCVILGTNSYKNFIIYNQSFIQDKYPVTRDQWSWTRHDYNANTDIYMHKNNRGIDKRCIYGVLVDKSNKRGFARDWKILSGKEYCTT